ncbi:MAG TPA: tetratricopeptide repeat protein [Fimbriimonadaceae bacterium]|nr:tetratricopeptide repeat protein [Fimbriimonadaceae bacterium]
MAAWKVRLFGCLRVTGLDQKPVRFRTRGAEAVFAFLALHAGESIRRETLMEVGWPGQPEASARQNLRTTLTSLRQTFGAEALDADRSLVRLVPEQFEIDVVSLRSGQDLSVYQGRFLEGLDGEWILAQAVELEDIYVQRVLELLDQLPESDALRLASEALSRNPSRLDLRLRLRELGAQPEQLATPIAATPFVGRESELAEVERILGLARWVTLTGPGGSGKTRIAAEFHRRRGSDSWYVSLVDCRDATQVGDVIRRALRVPSSTNRSAIEQVGFALGDSAGLLVLDNLEQLLDAKGELETLLSLCPNLHLLATSQVALGAAEEVEFPIGPLDVESTSVDLFLNRARLQQRNLDLDAHRETIGRICQVLEGYPLAIELAAGKLRMLSPDEILAQLDDRLGFLSDGSKTGRRHSLRSALDWSFERLGETEQTLLLDLSAFRGPFSIDAVRAVCAPESTLESLERLHGTAWISLVETAVGTRFRLLETMREFAEELISPKRLQQLRATHAHYFLGLSERCIHATFTSSEPGVYAEVDADIANLDQALEWFEQNDPEQALDFVRHLNWYWILRGQLGHAEDRMATAISRVALAPSAELGHAYQCYGNFLFFQGRLHEAEPWFVRAHKTCLEVGDPVFTGLSLCQLAQIHAEYGKYERAVDEAERSMPPLFEDGNPNWIGAGYVIACLVANRAGDVAQGKHFGNLAVQYCQEGGYPWGIASALNELAMAMHLAGEFQEAIRLQERSIELKEMGDAPRSMALSLIDLAATQFELGAVDLASESLRKAFFHLGRIKAHSMFPVAFLTAGILFHARGNPVAAYTCLDHGRRLAEVSCLTHAHLQPGLDLLASLGHAGTEKLDALALVESL